VGCFHFHFFFIFIFFDIKIIAGIVWDNADVDVWQAADTCRSCCCCCCTFAAETAAKAASKCSSRGSSRGNNRGTGKRQRKPAKDLALSWSCRMKTYYTGNIKLHTQHLNCVCPPHRLSDGCVCVWVCVSHMLHAAIKKRFSVRALCKQGAKSNEFSISRSWCKKKNKTIELNEIINWHFDEGTRTW